MSETRMRDVCITHHGAVTGVTGSCHEVWVDETHSVLIDCGLFQGAETSGSGASGEQLAIEFERDASRLQSGQRYAIIPEQVRAYDDLF